MANPTFAYPQSADITTIDPVLMSAQLADDPLIGPGGLFPIEYTSFDKLVWDQRDSYLGLMQFRGLNGDPPRVKRLGNKRFSVEPGAYGEFNEVDEQEMTRRAQPGSFNQPIEVGDLVKECHEQLMVRQNNRMRFICSKLLTTGSFVVLDKDGAIGAQDSYKIQVYTAPITWATSATARPLYDLRQIPILGRGQSTNFGAGSVVWMNQATFNTLLNNTNTADLRGERLDYGQTVKSVSQVNQVLAGNNLPTIVIYEEGYLDDTGTYQLFIPDNVVVYIGRRSNNAALGRFRMTKNISAPNFKGVYDEVITRGLGDNEPPPAKIEVHRGFNGGPVIWYPGSIFVMNV